jgi:hypothetical protein
LQTLLLKLPASTFGNWLHSFYSEIADVIERFFYDVKIIDKPEDTSSGQKKMNL